MQSAMTYRLNTRGGASPSVIEALVDVLRAEARLLRELTMVMTNQKKALAATDVQAVEDSVYGIHRLLHTLAAARERRRSINRVLAETDDIPIGEFESILGADMTADLRNACEEVRSSAGHLGGTLDDAWDALEAAALAYSYGDRVQLRQSSGTSDTDG